MNEIMEHTAAIDSIILRMWKKKRCFQFRIFRSKARLQTSTEFSSAPIFDLFPRFYLSATVPDEASFNQILMNVGRTFCIQVD